MGIEMTSEDIEKKRKERAEEVNREIVLMVCKGTSMKRIKTVYHGNELGKVSIVVDGKIVKTYPAIEDY